MGFLKRETVRSHWQGVALVCGKCSKKVGGGFGPKGKTGLARALRQRFPGKGRKAGLGVIETKCLKLCPKGAVTVVNGARPGEWLLVRPGTPMEDLVARLGVAASTE